MSTPDLNSPDETIPGALAEALRHENDRLRRARHEFTLFSGDRIGSFAGYSYYRFEIPEDFYLRNVEGLAMSLGRLTPVPIDGRIVHLANQFVTIAIPMDLGEVLPEISCRWVYDDHLAPIIARISALEAEHPILHSLFHPAAASNEHNADIDPLFLSTTPPDQQEALRKVLHNRVSFLWGPIRSGKTHVLCLAAANYIRAGKRVLFVAATNDRVDQTLTQVLGVSRELSLNVSGILTRVGLPHRWSDDDLRPYCLAEEIRVEREEKKKQVEEEVGLLNSYWKVRVKQTLHENFYVKLNELRERSNENRKQLERVAEDLNVLRETVGRAQSASMLDRLKKGFNKEELTAAQKQMAEKQALQKRLQAIQQAMTAELIRAESQTPLESLELREYHAAVKKIEERGGVQKVEELVRTAVAVDDRARLAAKRFVAASAATALADPRLEGLHYDLVIVDDVEAIQMPYLAALAGMATEKMIVSGDPYQLGPESYSNLGPAQTWLQRDIFLTVAGTERLQRLYDWSQQNSRWSVFLSSQYATTSKLSLFVASILFDEKVNVFIMPTRTAPSGGPKEKGKIYFIDTSDLRSSCRQYAGKKKIIPHNDLQTKKTVELVKHALMQPHRTASDVGVVVPFPGSPLYARLQLRLNGIRNVEVGTPQSFRGRRKKAIIFDTVMAGVDYTMRQIDDKKSGEHRVARLLNTIFSCVEEDLYVLADMAHFKLVYRDRLFTKLLMLLQMQADQPPPFAQEAKRFDGLEWDVRNGILDTLSADGVPIGGDMRAARSAVVRDAELEVRMKRMPGQAQQSGPGGRNFEREIYVAVQRVLGYREDVNVLSQTFGGDLLFRHSLSTEIAAGRLPTDACTDEEEFRKIMERWNLLIYEMSGGSKSDTAYFSRMTPETRVRWDINNLTAYFSSSVEAVVEEGKHRIATAVAKVFQECLGKQPANPVEWSTAYLNFLGKMEAYLAWISEQLRK